jgi:GxxExxY protein
MKPIVNPGYKYSDITGRIIGCAIEVHKELGPGFQERIYQNALAIEMGKQCLSFLQEN